MLIHQQYTQLKLCLCTGIPDALLPMMNALRMVWIISRHYSDDEKMGNLFRRIANMLANRVEESIDLQAIFAMPPIEALTLIDTASTVLSEWRETYLKVREHIEVSGQHARWEFPKTMLFERTGHIGDTLKELKFMVETVHDFFKFLGPELKAVTGDTEVCYRKHSLCWIDMSS
jgi:dynein heavy chain, axonemal